MDGGPPHTDTFDLKPAFAECGIFKPIQTALPGVQISELLPHIAKIMPDENMVMKNVSTSTPINGRPVRMTGNAAGSST